MKNEINVKIYNDLIKILYCIPAKKIRYSFRENFEPILNFPKRSV